MRRLLASREAMVKPRLLGSDPSHRSCRRLEESNEEAETRSTGFATSSTDPSHATRWNYPRAWCWHLDAARHPGLEHPREENLAGCLQRQGGSLVATQTGIVTTRASAIPPNHF